MNTYAEQIEASRNYYRSGITLSYEFRMEQLRKLRGAVEQNEQRIFEALLADLGKSATEAYMTEVGMVFREIDYAMAHLQRWMAKQYVSTPLALFPSKSFLSPHPYGVVLIVAPWNYPFTLTLLPLVGAIAAGNAVVIKPSELAPCSAELLHSVIAETFDENYIRVVCGGAMEAQALLNVKFDLIFYTGSGRVGKIVAAKAAESLTPVVLELGGKSPCIVSRSADLEIAARRIVFGKLLNAGQTCVAPDFVYADAAVKNALVESICKSIREFLPEGARTSDYPRCVNEMHLQRLQKMLVGEQVVCGGDVVDRKMSLAVLDNVTFSSVVMQEEIFGPVLPILSYASENEMIATLQSLPEPLALYLFANDEALEKRVLDQLNFGGGAINDCIMHLATEKMPFGGVGPSGLGSYRGHAGFMAFSHQRSIVKNRTWPDFPLRYRPYGERKLSWLRWFLS